MPRIDGTGPMGMGSGSGKGMGGCNGAKGLNSTGGLGCRRGCRGGFGRNSSSDTSNSQNDKDLLMAEKAILEKRLNLVNDQLNTLKDN